MILAALALFSHSALQASAVRAAVAKMAPQDLSDAPVAPGGIPKTLMTGLKLTIGTNGRIENCVVTAPSRWPALDPALCQVLTRMQLEHTGAFDHHAAGKTVDINMEWKPPRLW
jgi:hypothetical protein